MENNYCTWYQPINEVGGQSSGKQWNWLLKRQGLLIAILLLTTINTRIIILLLCMVQYSINNVVPYHDDAKSLAITRTFL